MNVCRIKKLAVAFATAMAVASGTASMVSCSSAPVSAADAVYDPAVWGPTYQGQVYCGYVYVPGECLGRPGLPMQFPTAQPSLVGSLAWALWTDYLTYPTYYHGDRYYNTIIVGRAHYRAVNINVFHTQSKAFDTRYAAAESKYDSQAKYKGPGGRVYTGNKYGSLTSPNRKTTNGSNGNAKTTTGGKKTTTGGGSYTGGRKTTTDGGKKTTTGGSSVRSNGYSGGRK